MLTHLVGRYLLLWAMLRALVSMIGLMAGAPMPPSPSFSLRFALLFGLVAYFDERRRGERVLLANLGVPLLTALGSSVAVALAGELLLAAVLGFLPVML